MKVIILLLLATACYACTSFYQSNIDIFGGGPVPLRSSLSAVTLDQGAVAFIGGKGPNGTCFNDLWIFNTIDNIWDANYITQRARCGHRSEALTLVSGGITFVVVYSFGNLFQADNSIDYYNYNTSQTGVSSATGPSARYYLQSASFSDVMIIYGGTDFYSGFTLSDTWAFNAAANAWTQMYTSNTPPALYGAASNWISTQNFMVVFGGANANGLTTTYYNDLWAFSFSTNSWVLLPSYGDVPSKRVFPNSIVLDTGILVVIGGESPTGIRLADAYTYDFTTHYWTILPVFAIQPRLLGAAAYSPLCPNNRAILYGDQGGNFTQVDALYVL